MAKSMIFEGKTTNEAIEKGLKEFHTTKDNVEIKIIEEEKRSFFSILEPRKVKIEMTLKDENKVNTNSQIESRNNEQKVEREEASAEEIERIRKELDQFLSDFISKLPTKNIQYTIKYENSYFMIDLNGNDVNYLIGYRGDSLNALQTIISAFISNHTKYKIRAILDIANYKEKRKKTLENLAERTASNVIRNNKQITLEPMHPYERKIIHTKLQNNNKVKTFSVGEEPHRKIVIAPK